MLLAGGKEQEYVQEPSDGGLFFWFFFFLLGGEENRTRDGEINGKKMAQNDTMGLRKRIQPLRFYFYFFCPHLTAVKY